MQAEWSEYMAGAFDDFDTITFGPWDGADLCLPGMPSLAQIVQMLPSDWRPDLFLLWRPEYGTIPVGLEDAPFATAALVSDWYLAFSDSLEAAWRVDVLVTGTVGERVFRAAGFANVLAMPMLGYQPAVDGTAWRPDSERDIDVFCGSNPNWAVHRERARVHAELRKIADRIRLREGPFVERAEFNRLMGRSRIFVNQTVIGEVNMKVYEAAASGACLFVEEENLDIRNYLVPDESVVLFNRKNINEKVLYYLEHEDKRAAIAERARTEMQPFTYRSNMRAIVDRLTGPEGIERFAGRRPVRELSTQERAEGLAGYALRHHGGDLAAAIALGADLGDGPRALLLRACAHYTGLQGGAAPVWNSGQILQAYVQAASMARDSVPAAYSLAQIATAHLDATGAQAMVDQALLLLDSGCAVPFSCADPYFGMEIDQRFAFERAAWEALVAGRPVDEALRPLLRASLMDLKQKI